MGNEVSATNTVEQYIQSRNESIQRDTLNCLQTNKVTFSFVNTSDCKVSDQVNENIDLTDKRVTGLSCSSTSTFKSLSTAKVSQSAEQLASAMSQAFSLTLGDSTASRNAVKAVSDLENKIEQTATTILDNTSTSVKNFINVAKSGTDGCDKANQANRNLSFKKTSKDILTGLQKTDHSSSMASFIKQQSKQKATATVQSALGPLIVIAVTIIVVTIAIFVVPVVSGGETMVKIFEKSLAVFLPLLAGMGFTLGIYFGVLKDPPQYFHLRVLDHETKKTSVASSMHLSNLDGTQKIDIDTKGTARFFLKKVGNSNFNLYTQLSVKNKSKLLASNCTISYLQGPIVQNELNSEQLSVLPNVFLSHWAYDSDRTITVSKDAVSKSFVFDMVSPPIVNMTMFMKKTNELGVGEVLSVNDEGYAEIAENVSVDFGSKSIAAMIGFSEAIISAKGDGKQAARQRPKSVFENKAEEVRKFVSLSEDGQSIVSSDVASKKTLVVEEAPAGRNFRQIFLIVATAVVCVLTVISGAFVHNHHQQAKAKAKADLDLDLDEVETKHEVIKPLVTDAKEEPESKAEPEPEPAG